MKNKIVSTAEAVAIIRDGDTVAFSGFVGSGTPEELIAGLADRFTETGSPRDLTLVFAAAPGDGKERGLNRLAHEGLVKRAVGGHWSLVPKLSALAVSGKIEAYNLPLGTLTQLFRDIAGHRAGTFTKVGLRTFVDPRLQGGRINDRTRDDLVRVMEIDGDEWLFYKAFPDLGRVHPRHDRRRLGQHHDGARGAHARQSRAGHGREELQRLRDRAGRARMRAGHAQSARGRGPRRSSSTAWWSPSPSIITRLTRTAYSPAYSGEIKAALDTLAPIPLDERKVIARRCAYELPMGGVVNLGIGMPEGVAAVADEEKVLRYVTLTAEPGVIGGIPQGGLDFGAAINTDAVIHQNQQFDFYDGGGLDMACLGMAQVDADGNVNVSRFGPRLAGAGGFINISQSARRVLFAGTFTTGGLEVAVRDGEALRSCAKARRASS